MTKQPETPHTAVLSLLTGHFNEISGYRAYRERGVKDWLLVYTVSGRGRFGHAGGDLIAEAGDWVLLRPGTRHDYGVDAEMRHWELLWAHFQPRREWLEWLNWPEVSSGLMRLRLPAETLDISLADVHRLSNGPHARREAFAMNALEAILLACDAQAAMVERHADQRIARTLAFFESHLGDKVTIDAVAASVGLSASRLAHLFKQRTGQTLQATLETRRMQVAANLLERTSFPVKRVAAEVGFESPFYFSQRFRRWAGQSPAQFRRAREGG